VPEQHWPLLVHGSPWAPQHTPPWQLPLQHCPPEEHVPPLETQPEVQVPPLQSPVQHSLFAAQVEPCPPQQAPAWQLPPQQSAGEMHEPPFAVHPGWQSPPIHEPVQHWLEAEQVSPEGLHERHVSLRRSAPLLCEPHEPGAPQLERARATYQKRPPSGGFGGSMALVASA
jgi:hypothetical protein